MYFVTLPGQTQVVLFRVSLLLALTIFSCKSEAPKSQHSPPPVPLGTSATSEECDEAALRAQVEGMRKSVASYVAPLIEVAHSAESCEQVTAKLVALEEHSKRLFAHGEAVGKSIRELPAECAARAMRLRDDMMSALGKKYPRADDIDAMIPKLAKRCEAHPGFTDALKKSVHSMPVGN